MCSGVLRPDRRTDLGALVSGERNSVRKRQKFVVIAEISTLVSRTLPTVIAALVSADSGAPEKIAGHSAKIARS